jgi:type I restriction enzyme M protein
MSKPRKSKPQAQATFRRLRGSVARAGKAPKPAPAVARRRPAPAPASNFELVFERIKKILWKDDDCDNELDYAEQISWLLFLRYLDTLEREKQTAARLEGKKFRPLLEQQYRWDAWAAPKKTDGTIDHKTATTGPDLIAFVNNKLFPYLASFKQTALRPDTIEYKVGEIFQSVENKVRSGYNLRRAIDLIDALAFDTQKDKHELSYLYENNLQRMGNAGRNGGQYYTPRPLIRAMIRVIKPVIGERIYDGALGSAGFLCETYEYLLRNPRLTTGQMRLLQQKTLYGREKKGLAFVLGVMNMILHGIEAPNVERRNTLEINVADIQDKERVDVILANPPFGSGEHEQIQYNFDIRSSESALLFMQHFLKMLKAGGRAAVVIKNTFLINTDSATVAVRRLLLSTCDVYAILDCPRGIFAGAGVKTVVLFFTKGRPTRRIWYYQLTPGRTIGKTTPLTDQDLDEFVAFYPKRPPTARSWTVDVDELPAETCDLSVRNPNAPSAASYRETAAILDDLRNLQGKQKELSDHISTWI